MTHPISINNYEGTPAQEVKKHEENSQVDAMLAVYMVLVEAVQISHETAYIQAKQVEANGLSQNKLIDEQSKFQLLTLSRTNISSKQLEQLELQNQLINAQRGVFENKLTVAQQDASQISQLLGAKVDGITQTIQQGSNEMTIEQKLGTQISQM